MQEKQKESDTDKLSLDRFLDRLLYMHAFFRRCTADVSIHITFEKVVQLQKQKWVGE